MINPLVCLGDGETLGGVGFRPAKVLNPKGHDGVWNLVKEFGTAEFERLEILDWYHLKENLYKVGGSLKRLKSAETLLWQGDVDEAKALFTGLRSKQAKKFIAYLDKHKSRIVNYGYYQAEQITKCDANYCALISWKVLGA